MRSVAIVGLGLMGGSFAKALKNLNRDFKIVGYDHHKKNQNLAKEIGFIDEIVTIKEALEADLIVLAIPVDAIVEFLNSIKSLNKNQTIIDLGSTKLKIVQNTPKDLRKNLVAAHPMAGTEKSGPSSAIDDLYRDKIVVLCDIEDSGEYQRELAKKIFSDIGMKIVYMDATSHDKDAAYISHLPHAISFALAKTVINQEDPKSIVALAGGGFKDMSRIAKSSPSMWMDIFSQNRDNLLRSIDDFQNELNLLKESVKEGNYEMIEEFIKEANSLHKIL